MACSTPPMYWSTGNHLLTFSVMKGCLSSFGERYRRKYQLESTNVSMVSISRRAIPEHFGQFVLLNESTSASGLMPCGLNSTFSGKIRSEEHTSELQSQSNLVF